MLVVIINEAKLVTRLADRLCCVNPSVTCWMDHCKNVTKGGSSPGTQRTHF